MPTAEYPLDDRDYDDWLPIPPWLDVSIGLIDTSPMRPEELFTTRMMPFMRALKDRQVYNEAIRQAANEAKGYRPMGAEQ